jgi:tetratricopeptide (TPR) repeat protein
VIATLQWGFSELLLSCGGLQDSLHQLIAIARTPSQTWAYEQFEIARDEFERQLYSESLESLRRAIDGHGSNAGYKTEYRFHFLLGTIRLGSYRNSDPTIVKPEEAELAFVNSARYAEHNHPEEAARALTSAGRAAFVQGQLARASECTRRALSLSPRHAPALYQLARLCCIDNDLNAGAKALFNAIVIDPDLSICASGEADFLSRRSMLNKVINAATNHFVRIATGNLHKFAAAIQKFSDFNFHGVSTRQLLDEEISSLHRTREQVTQSLDTRTLLGGVKAIELLKPPAKAFSTLFEEYRKRFATFVRSAQETNSGQERDETNHDSPRNYAALQANLQAIGIILLVGFVLVWLYKYGQSLPCGPPCGPGSWREVFNSFLVVFVILPSPVWMIMLFLRARAWRHEALESEYQRALNADTARRRQRSEEVAARRRQKLAELEATIRRLSDMPRPEFWQTEA